MILISFVYSGQEIPSYDEFEVYTQDKDNKILIIPFENKMYASAVDNETAAAIQRSLATLKEGRTVIAIAHRLSTIRNADKKYVLEDGKIVENGTHDELVTIGKVYSNLWDVQTGNR